MNVKSILIKVIFVNLSLLSLIVAYKLYVVELFSYMGFGWSFSLDRFMIGLFVLNILTLILSSSSSRVSDFLLNFHFLFPILPLIMLYIVNGYDGNFFLAISICFSVLILITRIKPYPIKSVKMSEAFFLKRLTRIVYLTMLMIFLLGGYKYFNLDISKVYNYRQDASDNLPPIFGYITPIVSKVLIPVIIVLGLKLKIKVYLLLGILSSILMFALTAHKSPLMYPFVVVTIYLLLTKFKSLNFMYVGYVGVIIILLLLAPISDVGGTLSSMILRRTFILPAFLNTLYYDFFSNNEFVYYSLSKLSLGLVEYPYPIRPGFLISQEYFGNSMQNSNTGWIGSGYMQAGIFGMFLYSIFLGLIIYIINCFSLNKDWKLISAALVGLFMSVFQSVDLLTSIFTHGLGVAILIIAFFPNRS